MNRKDPLVQPTSSLALTLVILIVSVALSPEALYATACGTCKGGCWGGPGGSVCYSDQYVNCVQADDEEGLQAQCEADIDTQCGYIGSSECGAVVSGTLSPGACNGFTCETTLVFLSTLEAHRSGGAVVLRWSTESEMDTAGFTIWRSFEERGDYAPLAAPLIPSEGDPVQGATYQQIDESCPTQGCCYKLEDIDTAGESTFHGPVCVEPSLPAFCGTPPTTGGVSPPFWQLLPLSFLLWKLCRSRRTRPEKVCCK